jgi:hypothetical protein
MIQLYFLSVLCNGLAGYVLFAGSDSDGEKSPFPVNNPTFYLILGILSAVTGILKLLSPVGRGIFILGDLIPAVAGITAGIVFIFGLYRQDVSSKSGELDRIGTNLLTLRKPIGMGLLAAAIIHFVFGELIFL